MARWEPPSEQVIEERPRRARWPLLVILLAFVGIAAAGAYIFRIRANPRWGEAATTTAVRSEVTSIGDTVQVVVTWRYGKGSGPDMADSIRVETGIGDGTTSTSRVFPNRQHFDTLRLVVDSASGTLAGYSCVAAVFHARLAPEACTPWQFVRPEAQPAATPTLPDSGRLKRSAKRAAPTVTRIVILPDGQQVDPDVGGRCSKWQQDHPKVPVWIDVNQQAVPECTGPNGKPTVAQFCAFAELSDGRRVTTVNSAGNRYCERLYERWVQERVT